MFCDRKGCKNIADYHCQVWGSTKVVNICKDCAMKVWRGNNNIWPMGK